MMIDLTNYETWFLLYADNELTAEERDEVVSFVKQHPSLQQEFDGILALRFSPDAENQTMNKLILRSNVMESKFEKMLIENELLLDHLDSEVSPEKAEELNQRFKKDSDLLASYNALLKLKLEPDETVVYPNKDELYRHHQPAIFDWRWPMAIAASLLFLTGLFWITNTENKVLENAVEVIAKDVQKKELNNNSIDRQHTDLKESEENVKAKNSHTNYLVSNPKKNKPRVDNTIEIESIPKDVVVESNPTIVREETLVAENSRSNNLPIQESGLVNSISSQSTANAEPIMANTFDESANTRVRKPFKQLVRKIGRVLGKEREESDQVKFIQVANIQFAVSKQ